jgi:alpha-ketoglutarate-dependent taurine dioxygenase
LTRTTTITISPVTRAVGAAIDGVDMRETPEEETVNRIRQAWLDRGVVFFRDQDISPDQLLAFVAHFGTPIPEPSNAAYGADPNSDPVAEGDTAPIKGVAERWHADATWLATPPMATWLRMVDIPPVGGDTCWVNVVAAYEALAEPLRDVLDTLTAVHWMMPSLETMGVTPQSDDIEYVHPVVRVHPETGRKALYVSEGWTRNIVDLPPAQSNLLLALVFDHIRSPDFSMRWRWTPGDVAFWDNRAVQHFAVGDYDGGRRIQRVVLAGDRPYGPGQVQ